MDTYFTTSSLSRRGFLATSGLRLVSGATGAEYSDVKGEIGVTTGSFMSHIAFEKTHGKIQMLDLPSIMRNELDMRVIDFMSRTLESFDPIYLERLRAACDDNQCVVTNLKCNQKGIDMASPNKGKRNEALKIYRESIDAAQILGARWIRPISGGGRNVDRDILADSYRRLIDYGAEHDIQIVIENVGWISSDPDAIPDMIKRVGAGLVAGPDTGNWADDATRYDGLAKAYPHAETTDFKAFQFEEDGTHPKYDLKKCFEAGWSKGFRGPWCIEHFHKDLPGLIKGFGAVRDLLRGWISEKSRA